MNEVKLPRVLIVSATPLEGSWATSRLMTDLFARWPADSLAQVTVSRPGSDSEAQPVESLYLDLGGEGGGLRNPIRLVGELRRFTRFVEQTKPDVVYFRSAGWPLLLELAPLALGRFPVVTHLMDDWPESRRVSGGRLGRVVEGVLRRVLAKSSARLAISEPMATAFADRYGVTFDVVHAGTDRVPRDAPRPVGGKGESVVFYSGSIAEDQTASSIVELAQAVAVLRERGVAVRFTVAPSSHMSATLTDRLESAGAVIEEQVSQQDYLDRLVAADVVVATANFDERSIAFLRYSMPNKIPDLLASGTPMLLYAPGDLAYVQDAQRQGWASVVDMDAPDILAAAIEVLLSNEELRADLVASAAEACASNFAWRTQRDRFERVVLAAAVSEA